MGTETVARARCEAALLRRPNRLAEPGPVRLVSVTQSTFLSRAAMSGPSLPPRSWTRARCLQRTPEPRPLPASCIPSRPLSLPLSTSCLRCPVPACRPSRFVKSRSHFFFFCRCSIYPSASVLRHEMMDLFDDKRVPLLFAAARFVWCSVRFDSKVIISRVHAARGKARAPFLRLTQESLTAQGRRTAALRSRDGR